MIPLAATLSGDVTMNAPEPRIRRASPDDLPAVERLLRASDLPVAGVAEIFAGHADDFLVVEAADGGAAPRLIAAAGLEVRGADAVLRSAAVDPAWRSRGIGGRLTTGLLAMAQARGLRALYLLTTTAERYFPRFGFAPITRAEVPAAIADTVEFREACPASAVVMTRPMRPMVPGQEPSP